MRVTVYFLHARHFPSTLSLHLGWSLVKSHTEIIREIERDRESFESLLISKTYRDVKKQKRNKVNNLKFLNFEEERELSYSNALKS